MATAPDPHAFRARRVRFPARLGPGHCGLGKTHHVKQTPPLTTPLEASFDRSARSEIDRPAVRTRPYPAFSELDHVLARQKQIPTRPRRWARSQGHRARTVAHTGGSPVGLVARRARRAGDTRRCVAPQSTIRWATAGKGFGRRALDRRRGRQRCQVTDCPSPARARRRPRPVPKQWKVLGSRRAHRATAATLPPASASAHLLRQITHAGKGLLASAGKRATVLQRSQACSTITDFARFLGFLDTQLHARRRLMTTSCKQQARQGSQQHTVGLRRRIASIPLGARGGHSRISKAREASPATRDHTPPVLDFALSTTRRFSATANNHQPSRTIRSTTARCCKSAHQVGSALRL